MSEGDAEADRPLPFDSDIEVSESADGSPRPVHLNWRFIGLVFLGGALGTVCRCYAEGLLPDWNGIPLGVAAVNLAGAFALGLVLESLVRPGGDSGSRRTLRLLVGTGFLGGFTTYSSLAAGVEGLLRGGDPWGALLYGGGTVLAGAAATVLGIAAAHRRRRRAKGPA